MLFTVFFSHHKGKSFTNSLITDTSQLSKSCHAPVQVAWAGLNRKENLEFYKLALINTAVFKLFKANYNVSRKQIKHICFFYFMHAYISHCHQPSAFSLCTMLKCWKNSLLLSAANAIFHAKQQLIDYTVRTQQRFKTLSLKHMQHKAYNSVRWKMYATQ